MSNSHKRGDLSPCGTLRFWQYQSYTLKKTGKRGERWIPANQYEEYRKDSILRGELCSARTEFRKMQKTKNNPNHERQTQKPLI
jgi:hypothetical protein